MADTDDQLDPEDLAFLAAIARGIRTRVIRKLLSGNDAGCFTTEQYRKAHDRIVWKNDAERVACPLREDLARMHLRSMAMLVKEVQPDVWAAVED